MQERKIHTDSAAKTPALASPDLGAKLLRVAWLAILLGFVMEGLLLLLGTGLGEVFGLDRITADLVKNVSWALFVCAGLAVGTTIAKARLPLAGLAGLLSAPLAFEVSRILHKGTLEALSTSGGTAEGAFPFLIALVKGLEYACLGMLIGWLGSRPWGGALAHAATGLAIGLVFGGAILALTMGATPQPSNTALISQGVNEVLFPVGCSLVLFSAAALGKKMAPENRSFAKAGP